MQQIWIQWYEIIWEPPHDKFYSISMHCSDSDIQITHFQEPGTVLLAAILFWPFWHLDINNRKCHAADSDSALKKSCKNHPLTNSTLKCLGKLHILKVGPDYLCNSHAACSYIINYLYHWNLWWIVTWKSSCQYLWISPYDVTCLFWSQRVNE